MKLSELYERPIAEVVKEMKLVDLQVHTDDSGNIKAIELEYADDSSQHRLTSF